MAGARLPSSTSSASLAHAHAHASGHSHATYILLAEFDIDQGSILKHQYPAPTGTDEHLLAEHMLPDGAHDRAEDWTVFYLNQVPALSVDPTLLVQARADLKGKGRAVDQDAQPDNGVPIVQDDGGLLYVMSLVRTKKDASVRRGALVKALAVATRNPYIQIFKPILLLALEDYFNAPSVSVLANLYTSLNAIDTSALPLLSADERTILRTWDHKDLFKEKFAAATSEGSPPSGAYDNDTFGAPGRLHIMPSSESLRSLARSPSIGSAASSARDDVAAATTSAGGRTSRANTVSSLGDDRRTSWSNSQSYGGYQPPVPALPHRQSSGATQSTTSLAGSGASPTVTRGVAAVPKDTHFFETKVEYGGITLPVKIPMATFPGEVGDYSLIKLIQTFSSPTALSTSPFHPHLHTSGHTSTPALIVLFNALLAGHRVVFLGHQQPAGRVAELVLAACALVSGCGAVLPGIEARAFPYTNLANLENLERVDGYIAGVCNPAFADRPTWWDVLCNIETGKITISKELKPPAPASAAASAAGTGGGATGRSTLSRASEFASWPGGVVDELGQLNGGGGMGAGGGGLGQGAQARGDGKESQDVVFIDEILNAIQSHYGEAVIRARFVDYVSRFVRLASRYEEDTTAATTIGFPSAQARDGHLGSGIVFNDESVGAREVAVNAPRIEAWMKTPSYRAYQAAFRDAQLDSPFRPALDLAHQLARLRLSRTVAPSEAVLILRSLSDALRSDAATVALLAALPAHFGGLLPLAFGLFHPTPEARHYTLELLDRLSAHPTGRIFVAHLNAFHRLAYARLTRDRDAAVAAQQQQHQTPGRERGREREETVRGPPPVPGKS